MIKKLVLLVLVLILIPLTYLLYRQMEELRPASEMKMVQEVDRVEQDLDPQKIMRQWTPPKDSMAPEKDSVTEANRLADASSADMPDAAAMQDQKLSESSPQTQQTMPSSSDGNTETFGSDKGKFTDQELISPQQEVTELMSALQARSLRKETNPSLDTPEQQSAFPASQPLPKGINTLKGLHVVPQDDAVLIQLVGLGDIGSYKYFFIGSPSRLVVDLLGKYDRSIPERDLRDNVFIKDIRTGRHPDKLRIVADLKSTAQLRLSVEKPQSNVLVLRLTKK